MSANASDAGGGPARWLPSAWVEPLAWLAAAVLVAVPVALAGRSELATPALPILLALVSAWIAWEDIRRLTIPDAATAALAGLATVDLLSTSLFQFDPSGALMLFALEAVLCGGALFLLREIHFRRRGHDGIGFGDVKLAAAGGLLCGLGGFSVALLVASLVGLAVAAVIRMRGRRPDVGAMKLAFGALLAPTLWLVWFLEGRW